MNKIDLLLKLNDLEYDIIKEAYLEDYDGDDENGHPIIRKVYKGLEEQQLKSLLNKITDIISYVKEGK